MRVNFCLGCRKEFHLDHGTDKPPEMVWLCCRYNTETGRRIRIADQPISSTDGGLCHDCCNLTQPIGWEGVIQQAETPQELRVEEGL